MARANKQQPSAIPNGDGGTVPESRNGIGSTDGGVQQPSGNPEIIDPATIAGTATAGDASEPGTDGGKRKRGRPKGSTNRAKEIPPPTDIGSIQAVLLATHLALSVLLKDDIWQLTDDEAKMLAESVKRVEKYYPVISSLMSGKIADHVALFAVVGQVYGTRILALKLRMDKQKKENVRPLHTVQ